LATVYPGADPSPKSHADRQQSQPGKEVQLEWRGNEAKRKTRQKFDKRRETNKTTSRTSKNSLGANSDLFFHKNISPDSTGASSVNTGKTL